MIIDSIGNILTWLLDILILPFRSLPPFWGLLFISLLAGLGMITIFRLVSDQYRISKLRKRMFGEVLGILLHVSSPLTVIRFAGKLIWSNTLYLLYILKPLFVIAVPFMLLWGQLDARYGTYAMDQDFQVTVTVKFDDSLPEREEISVNGSGIEIIPPVMMVDTLREISFRMVAAGEMLRSLEVNGTVFAVGRTCLWKGAVIQRGFDRRNTLKRLFCPWIVRPIVEGEGPASGWYSLPAARYGLLGGHWSWLAVFLVFSTCSAILGAIVFRIKI